MSYKKLNKSFFTLVRGSATWNDTFDSNESFIENSGNSIQTKNNLEIPMFIEAYKAASASGGDKVYSYKLDATSSDRYKFGQFNSYDAGAYAISDDKAIETSKTSFTYTIDAQAGSGTLNELPEYSSSIIFFPKEI